MSQKGRKEEQKDHPKLERPSSIEEVEDDSNDDDDDDDDDIERGAFSASNHNSRPNTLVIKMNDNDASAKSTGDIQGKISSIPSEQHQRNPALDSTRSELLLVPPRLVERNRVFFQSSNKLRIQHNQGSKILKLLKHNWFHAFLRLPTRHSVGLLLTVWTGSILFFASLYVAYDHADSNTQCHLGLTEEEPMTFGAAFAFSLETCTTVGYGLPHGINSYFEKCQMLQVIIYFQMLWSMLFNAFLITFLYNRLGRSENRGAQVVFSKQALVSRVDGQVRFQFRLFDVDARRPVVEAHVRLYVVHKERPVPRPLRLLQPDDELGGMLFLSFPSIVSHHIDLYSLLHPPSDQLTIHPSGLVLRQVDGTTSNRDDIICPVCGESYGTMDRWWSHVKYQQIVEEKDDYPKRGTHLSLNLQDIEEQIHLQPTTDIEVLKKNFQTHISEVICVVEGIDPITSGTFQSLHSYRFEDIVWHAHTQFSPCMEIVHSLYNGNYFQVDLDRYHDMDVMKAPTPTATPTKQSQPRRRRKQTSLRHGDSFFSTNTMTVRAKKQEEKDAAGSRAFSPPLPPTTTTTKQGKASGPFPPKTEDNEKRKTHRSMRSWNGTNAALSSLFLDPSSPPTSSNNSNPTVITATTGAPSIPLASLFEPPKDK